MKPMKILLAAACMGCIFSCRQPSLPEGSFNRLRKELEKMYSETRILEKPADYILDQDHHHHLANQTLSFDWQFTAELFFLEKLMSTYSFK
jgi:hypothetical protein